MTMLFSAPPNATTKRFAKGKIAPITILLLAAAFFGSTAPASAVDPFYQRLMRDGSSRLQAGDFQQAAKKLELACFGMLDEVPALTQCQVYLALAYGNADDQAKFTETFERLTDLERSFRTLSELELSTDLKRQLDQFAERWIPYETLRSTPPFARVARQKLEASILDLPVADRKEKLTILLQEEPNALSWRILMAEVDLATGNFKDASDEARQVLTKDSELLGAICVRGQAQAALGECAEALTHLYACDEDGALEAITLYKARCHLAVGQLDKAEAEARSLPNAQRRPLLREIQKTRREVDRQRRNAPPKDVEEPVDEPSSTESASAAEASEGANSPAASLSAS